MIAYRETTIDILKRGMNAFTHPDTIAYLYLLTPVVPSFIKRNSFQRLVAWNIGNIFSENSGIRGGYPRMTPV